MGKSRFWGGVHPLGAVGEGKTQTRNLPIQDFAPQMVRIPMNMHLGAPSTPCVHPGEKVKIGQVIADAVGALGVLVHASVSGTVKEVLSASEAGPACVLIENDFQNEWIDLPVRRDIETCDHDEILPAIRDAGICGMGGAGFPTHVKMCIPCGDRCETVLINGSECETHLTSDQRLMVEEPERILLGLRAAMRAFGSDKGQIAIEENKPDAIQAMKTVSSKVGGVSVEPLATRYPQGGEKQLIQAVTGREVPFGKLPIDVGVVVLNVATAHAIADAVEYGKPLVERIVTVTGKVERPANLRVPIGTMVGDILKHVGGDGEARVVLGGAMMGMCASSAEAPITKGGGGVVVLDAAEMPSPSPCIRCGRCAQVCPIGLVPYEMEANAHTGRLKRAEEIGVMDCILCGSCSYICPAHRLLAPTFRTARQHIQEERRKKP